MALLVTLATPATEAHKAITSKYNFNDHVFPILRDRCSRCHYQGGPTPMSLTTYNDALPWAESIREQLVGERMPPWYADPVGPQVKGYLQSNRSLFGRQAKACGLPLSNEGMRKLRDWVNDALHRSAGEPGPDHAQRQHGSCSSRS